MISLERLFSFGVVVISINKHKWRVIYFHKQIPKMHLHSLHSQCTLWLSVAVCRSALSIWFPREFVPQSFFFLTQMYHVLIIVLFCFGCALHFNKSMISKRMLFFFLSVHLLPHENSAGTFEIAVRKIAFLTYSDIYVNWNEC